ncbi:hypothetical protein [Hwanghaeella sp.]|uniref:hypothetical protein n=1 Tax=Hwanghaeella sp. TaxID=2605943 RepID=UPI003CCBB4AF
MYLNPNVYDQGLAWLVANAARLDICSAEPANYAQATTDANLSVGNETGITVGAPADAGTGRKVTVPAVVAGDVTETATATHWALTDGAGVLIATGALAAGQVVTDGNTWALGAFDITLPGLAA